MRKAGFQGLPRAWPAYVPEPVERVLATMQADGSLLTEHGEILTPTTWQDLSNVIYENNLLVWIGSVWSAMQDWIPEMLADMRPEGRKERGQWCELQWNDNRKEMAKVRIHRLWPNKRGRMQWQVRELAIAGLWGRQVEAALTTDLRAAFTILGVGVHSTPGQAGTACIKQLWKGKKPADFRRHYRPPLPLVQQLEQHMIGSRREAYRPDEVFDQAYELDAKNGYCAQWCELPCGTITHYKNGQEELWVHPRDDFFCWWGECYVKILEQGLAPGDVAPFATRDEEGKLHWPTAPGLYHCWLWSFEAEEIRKRTAAGEPIMCYGVAEAWAWSESTTQLAEAQRIMDQAREAGKAISEDVGNLIKTVIVAATGAMGLPMEYVQVSTEPKEGSVSLEGPDLPDQTLYLSREFKDDGTPKHWQAYILARMNHRIYEQLRKAYLAGIVVICANVDAIITQERPYWGTEPGYTRIGEFKLRKMGSWVACPGPGMVLDPDNQRIDIPGMSWDEKLRAMQLYRIGERVVPRRGERIPTEASDRLRWAAVMHAHADRLRRYIRSHHMVT